MRPGVVFVGLGFFAIASIIHCIPIGSAHMSVAPMMFSLPGTHTQWFVPGRNTVILPSGPISVTVASRVMQSGPERSARRILAFAISSDMVASPFIWFPSFAGGGAPTLGGGPCVLRPARRRRQAPCGQAATGDRSHELPVRDRGTESISAGDLVRHVLPERRVRGEESLPARHR